MNKHRSRPGCKIYRHLQRLRTSCASRYCAYRRDRFAWCTCISTASPPIRHHNSALSCSSQERQRCMEPCPKVSYAAEAVHSLSLSARRKSHALPSDLSDPYLGLDSTTHRAIAQNLASIIHCAWSVNFNWNLSTFEKDCISGVRHLLNLCLAVPSSKPASFDFCSFVSTVARCPDAYRRGTI